MLSVENCFIKRDGCPFCHQSDHSALCEIDYHDTAEANQDLPNVHGKIFHCPDCGIAYPSHAYKIEIFDKLYQKSFNSKLELEDSWIQLLRKEYIKRIVNSYHKKWSFSGFLNNIALSTFQVPKITKKMQGLEILDVGCGFGEFLEIYKDLQNNVTGTEIHPALVRRLQHRGFNCKEGEIEDIDFHGARFDVIILRAVFYRTRDPLKTLTLLKSLLMPKGELVLLDPCPGRNGVEFFLRKQFPQGQFYIIDKSIYLNMIENRFKLTCDSFQLMFGRPPNKPPRSVIVGSIIGLFRLLIANSIRVKPYMLNYDLVPIKKSSFYD